MARIKIVGAGQLGSRHLQALKAIAQPLEIVVIDPSEASLKVAKERYDAVTSPHQHHVTFTTKFEPTAATEIAIVATSSNVRRKALESLFATGEHKYLVLEKLLFNDAADYAVMEQPIKNGAVAAWVNCPMRVMATYEQIKRELSASPVSYRVTGSQYGMVTNAIHYIDHLAHLTNCEEFELDTSGLDRTVIASKRPGFAELNGTVIARFANGSRCEVTCYPTGNAPVIVEIFGAESRYLVRESERKLWYADESSQWAWQEREAPIPYQSEITTGVVQRLLATGQCGLTPYSSSVGIHLRLLNPLLNVLKLQSPEMSQFPFT